MSVSSRGARCLPVGHAGLQSGQHPGHTLTDTTYARGRTSSESPLVLLAHQVRVLLEWP